MPDSTAPGVVTYTEKPARKHHEYLGNTRDEKNIIQKVRNLMKFKKDENGNDDKLFKASHIKRVEKPMVPGDDEDRYAQNNGEVKNIDPSADRNPDASGYGFDGTKKKGFGESRERPIVHYQEIKSRKNNRDNFKVVKSQHSGWKKGHTFSDDDMSMGSRQVKFIPVDEETEEAINELSSDTLKSYIRKAHRQAFVNKSTDPDKREKRTWGFDLAWKKQNKRDSIKSAQSDIKKAQKKLEDSTNKRVKYKPFRMKKPKID